jgi:hypothetical protein
VWESNDLKSKKTPSYNTLNKGKAREYSKITLAFCACSLTVFFFLFFLFFFFDDFRKIQVLRWTFQSGFKDLSLYQKNV